MGAAVTINDLRIELAGSGIDIVDDVNLTIQPGEVLGLVGESGSGKTTVGLAVLGHARRGVKLAGGSVTIGDAAMLSLGETALRHARGRLVTYVPQDPSTALNPALRIHKQMLEVLEFHN
ncbi:MAG: peptide/nickel transport system ATP-binding protein ddpF, partial [Ilumatobacteraceae bacterium]